MSTSKTLSTGHVSTIQFNDPGAQATSPGVRSSVGRRFSRHNDSPIEMEISFTGRVEQESVEDKSKSYRADGSDEGGTMGKAEV